MTERKKARWYCANDPLDEHWRFCGMSRREAVGNARDHECGWIAPEAEPAEDSDFWKAVAGELVSSWAEEAIDEALAEGGWIDPEDGWLISGGKPARTLERLIAGFLATQTELARPEWRTVAIDEAEAVPRDD